MARAIYSRKRIMIFDDTLSGLDTVTEDIVFSRVFGKTGLLRQTGTTAILATHGSKAHYPTLSLTNNPVNRLPEANHIIILGAEGRVLEQGPFNSLTSSGEYVQNIAQIQYNNGSAGPENNDERVPRAVPEPMPVSNTPGNTRQTGDWRIYKYYFLSLGWINLFIFGALITSNSALYIVQCKFSPRKQKKLLRSNVLSSLVELVGTKYR